MRSRIFMMVAALGVTLLLIPSAGAQTEAESVTLRIRLRAADGRPLSGEPITLQRLPDEESVLPECTTDAQGACAWRVGRGLYQVLFARPLDGVTALALAEGGLRGFGLTVGEADVTYHFTLHGDGHVYFDAAPEAAVAAPIIPTPDPLHGGVAPLPTPKATAFPETDAQLPSTRGASPTATAVAEPVGDRSGRWPLALFVGLGLALGGGLHLWSGRRRRRKPDAGHAQEAGLVTDTASAGRDEEEHDA